MESYTHSNGRKKRPMDVEKSMSPLDDAVIGVPETVLFHDLGEETLVLDMVKGDYYGLNEVGARIWTLSVEGRTVTEVVSILLSEYHVSEEQLREDVKQFLLQLKEQGLVEIYEQVPG